MTFSSRQVAEDYLQRLFGQRPDCFRNPGYFPAKLAEEAGEAMAEANKRLGFSRHSPDTHKEAEELADVVISAYAQAIMAGIDLDKAIQAKHTNLMSRSRREEGESMHGDGGFDENMIDWDKVEITVDRDKLLQEQGMACGVQESFPADEWPVERDAAFTFLTACGIDPNPDAISQLVEAFLPALRIMCQRPHDPNGQTWRAAGWRAQLYELIKKVERVRYSSWTRNLPQQALKEIPDIINYAGFLQRGIETGLTQWGEWGNPGEDQS